MSPLLLTLRLAAITTAAVAPARRCRSRGGSAYPLAAEDADRGAGRAAAGAAADGAGLLPAARARAARADGAALDGARRRPLVFCFAGLVSARCSTRCPSWCSRSGELRAIGRASARGGGDARRRPLRPLLLVACRWRGRASSPPPCSASPTRVGEFGVVLMIGGNIPGRTRVVSIAIYDHVESLDYAGAHQLSACCWSFSFRCCCSSSSRPRCRGRTAGERARRARRRELGGFRSRPICRFPARLTAWWDPWGLGKSTLLRCIAGLEPGCARGS